jgi:hypothetical protein
MPLARLIHTREGHMANLTFPRLTEVSSIRLIVRPGIPPRSRASLASKPCTRTAASSTYGCEHLVSISRAPAAARFSGPLRPRQIGCCAVRISSRVHKLAVRRRRQQARGLE